MTRSHVSEPRLVVCWGELLWDLYPDRPRLGGCAANVAYHVRRLGSPCALVSRVGDDELGRRALSLMGGAGVDVSTVQVDGTAPTGVVRVHVSGGEPSFELVTEAAWDRIEWTEQAERGLARARVFYFGTLAQRTPFGAAESRHALERCPPECVRLCDLNVRSPFVSPEVVEACVGFAHVIKLNDKEAEYCTRTFGCRDVLTWLFDRPGVRLVALTRGANGCLLATREHRAEIPAVSYTLEGDGGDAVGAGDAFAAVLAHHLPVIDDPQILGVLASRYAGFVASRVGAMPEVPDAIVEKALRP